MSTYRDTLISPWIEVYPDRIRHNVETVKAAFPPGKKIICVLKTNGYGHGIIDVARTLADVADSFAVVEARSAIRLREAGITKPILLLSPFHSESLTAAGKYNFSLSVNDDAFPEKVSEMPSLENQVDLHIQLNTGMNRHGITPARLPEMVQFIQSHPDFNLSGVYSNPSGVSTAQDEFKVFQNALVECPTLSTSLLRHFSNSATLLAHPETQLDALRFGILIYGIFPRDDVPMTLPIRPALTWKACINLIRDLPAGSIIGYGGRQRITRPLQLAVISCGYGHGYLRRLGADSGQVLIHGKRCPLLAPPNMNDMLADVTGLKCQIGDEVVLLGQQGQEEITAGELADRLDTIEAEILCLLDRTPNRMVCSESEIKTNIL